MGEVNVVYVCARAYRGLFDCVRRAVCELHVGGICARGDVAADRHDVGVDYGAGGHPGEGKGVRFTSGDGAFSSFPLFFIVGDLSLGPRVDLGAGGSRV